MIILTHYVYGGVVCAECGTYHDEAKIQDISDEDYHGSLIYCTDCSKWTKWNNQED